MITLVREEPMIVLARVPAPICDEGEAVAFEPDCLRAIHPRIHVASDLCGIFDMH
jgi:hypothetical protein